MKSVEPESSWSSWLQQQLSRFLRLISVFGVQQDEHWCLVLHLVPAPPPQLPNSAPSLVLVVIGMNIWDICVAPVCLFRPSDKEKASDGRDSLAFLQLKLQGWSRTILFLPVTLLWPPVRLRTFVFIFNPNHLWWPHACWLWNSMKTNQASSGLSQTSTCKKADLQKHIKWIIWTLTSVFNRWLGCFEKCSVSSMIVRLKRGWVGRKEEPFYRSSSSWVRTEDSNRPGDKKEHKHRDVQLRQPKTWWW